MSEAELHHWLTLAVFGFAAIVFALLFFITAPYGRHTRKGWGPQMSARLGWITFESPPVIVFAWIFFRAENMSDACLIVTRIFTADWLDPTIPLLALMLVASVWLYQFLYESSARRLLELSAVRIARPADARRRRSERGSMRTRRAPRSGRGGAPPDGQRVVGGDGGWPGTSLPRPSAGGLRSRAVASS